MKLRFQTIGLQVIVMFTKYKIDLHIHTALSPCADDEMTPPKIIHAARAKGLHMIAVTDHNSAANAAAVTEAAAGSGIVVIPGMEVQTREEVHLICLFETGADITAFQDFIQQKMPSLKNNTRAFGHQRVMNGKGEPVREEEKLLLTSADLSVEEVTKTVKDRGGICIPAHVNRPSYSLLASLGFIPPSVEVAAVEISRHTNAEEARFIFPELKNYNIIGSSDAHVLTDIGIQHTYISIGGPPSFNELKLALENRSGRKVVPGLKELSLHIIDIIQNSIEAGAGRISITITEDTLTDRLELEITDNGRGMEKELLDRVTDPFFTTRTTRRIGLGLPLLKAAAERCEGEMSIQSTPGKGTRVYAAFRHSHIDRAPLGNMVDTVVNTVVGHPELDLLFIHRLGENSIVFDAAELRRELEDVPLNNPAVINWIRNYLTEGYRNLYPVAN